MRERLTARIQHHPERAGLIPRLLQRLDGLEVEVFTDRGEDPNPYRGYRACLEDLPADGHLLIVQDDALPCANFAAAVGLVAAANPGHVVALFLGGRTFRTRHAILQAHTAGDRYVWLNWNDPLPLVATLWPVELARNFRDWADTHPRRVTKADDGVAQRWMQSRRQYVRVTVPSLVEHPDDTPSVKNRKRPTYGFRTATVFIGDTDPLALDWT